MIATLLWKDYREQSGMWLGIAAVALLLIFGLGAMAQGGLYGVTHDQLMGPAVFGVAFSLLFGYGAACGAMLLAGEKEAATLDFLDAHLGKRRPLWENKLALGAALVISQALWLALLMLLVGLGTWHHLIVFPLLAFDALAWGMLAGACSRAVLPAVLLGIGLLIFSWLATLALVSPILPDAVLPAKFALAIAVMLVARQVFCEPDTSRRTSAQTLPAPSSWRALLWLSLGQGRVALLIGLAVCMPAIGIAFINPLLLWPAVSLLIGLLCGLAVFGFEQVGEQERFLGAQRLPPGRVWLARILFWALAAVLFAVLVGGLTLLAQIFYLAHVPQKESAPSRLDWYGEFRLGTSRAWLLSLWALHGFCFAQFFALLTRRPIVALFMAGGASVLVLMLWVPSLIAGGLSPWAMLPIPLLLVFASRLATWPWFGGRIFTKQSLLVGSLGALAIVGWLAGNLALRAYEIPDVGEPFDMRALNTALDRAAASPATRLMPQVLLNLHDTSKEVTSELGPPRRNPFPPDPNLSAISQVTYEHVCAEVTYRGWPAKDEEIARWLDRIMAGQWAEQADELASAPLGLWFDPRRHSRADYHRLAYGELPLILNARAVQLQAKGDTSDALKQVGKMLALARQYGHFQRTDLYLDTRLTANAFSVLGLWLTKDSLDKSAMRKVIDMLLEHERKWQDEAERHKADFLVQRNDRQSGWLYRQQFPQPEASLLIYALAAPWEAERQRRLQNAMTHARLERLAGRDLPADNRHSRFAALAENFDLPRATGPTISLSAERWGRILGSDNYHLAWYFFMSGQTKQFAQLRGLLAQYAVALYQADEGRLPDKLQDLVPHYLPAVPIDPFHERPLSYMISNGEELQGAFGDTGDTRRVVPAGDALIWYENNGRQYFIVAAK